MAHLCDATLKAYTLAADTRANYNDAYQALYAYRNATATQWTTWSGYGAAQSHGKTFQSMVDGLELDGSPQLTEVSGTLAAFTTSSANAPLYRLSTAVLRMLIYKSCYC